MHNSLKSKLPEVTDLLKQHKVKSAYVFGSVLTNEFNPSSDIDLLVYFKKVPFKGYADNFFALEEKLVKVLGRKVDIVPGHTLSNPYFIASINRNKVALYEQDLKKYDAVDDPMIWDIVVNHLPLLEREVGGLLED